MAEKAIAHNTVLAVFPSGEDRGSLQKILGRSQWDVRFTATIEEARNALRGSSFAVVISEGRLPDGRCWKDLLHELQEAALSPPLIVVDRLADDRLWAEVLNLGGYDLLHKPFESNEVLRAVTMACRFRGNKRCISVLSKPGKRAQSGGR